MKKHFAYFSAFLIVMNVSCKKINEDDVEPYKGKSYFPVNVGHELVYNVEHITFSSFTQQWDTSNYQIREVVASTYKDNENRETQRIERYIKNDTTNGNFIIYQVWAENLLTSTAQRVEENIRFIKLTFPQNLNQNWNGNSLNSQGVKYYTYSALHVPLSLNSLNFDSTCTVLQSKDSNATYDRLQQEMYATKIGMIYKIDKNIEYGNGMAVVTSASIYKETLESYIE